MLIYAFIYLFYFINENVEEPLGCAVLVFFFFWNLIRMKTLQFKNLFGRIFFFFYLDDILFIVTETDFDIRFWFWYTFIISWYYNVT